MKLRYTPQSLQDLQGIREYIEEDFCNPDAASNILSDLLDSCEHLAVFPNLGAKLKDKLDMPENLPDYHYLIHGSYLILYRFDDADVSIIRILDGRTAYWKHIL